MPLTIILVASSCECEDLPLSVELLSLLLKYMIEFAVYLQRYTAHDCISTL